MSSDSTEITFVRCPSCHSLVPAASARCRMCGVALDTLRQGDQTDTKEKNKRVRQRTVSEQQQEMTSAVNQIREEASADTFSPVPTEVIPREISKSLDKTESKEEKDSEELMDLLDSEEGSDDYEDPLSDYLDDVDEDEEGSIEDKMEEFLSDDEEEFFDDDFLDEDELDETEEVLSEDSVDKTVATEELKVSENQARKTTETPSVNVPSEDGSKEPSKAPPFGLHSGIPPVAGSRASDDKKDSEPKTAQTSFQGLTAKKEPYNPRVVIESGSRPKGGGLSFGKKKAEIKTVQSIGEIGVSEEHSTSQEVTEDKVSVLDETQNKKGVLKDSEESRPEEVVEKKEIKVFSRETTMVGGEKNMETPNVSSRAVNIGRGSAGEVVRPQEVKKGRLVGWLVNYADQDGVSVELREGRYFATRDGLKANDFIIDDPSVSTPHALVIVGMNGVMVQDLMSDRGVFFRGQAADSYQRGRVPFRVSLGDWIRFGDIEFLVSLIAHVGEK